MHECTAKQAEIETLIYDEEKEVEQAKERAVTDSMVKNMLDTLVRSGRSTQRFECTTCWHAQRGLTRTKTAIYTLICLRPDSRLIYSNSRSYRNPLIYARELHDEMVGDNLTRKQLAQRHEITSDRVTQWLCLLKLPSEIQQRVLALGDNWSKQIVTERKLRRLRRRKDEPQQSTN